MKQKLLFTLLLLMFTSSYILAEDDPQVTAPPVITYSDESDHAILIFECEEDATIYACINDVFCEFSNGDSYWIDYTYEEQILSVIAYAVAPDKETSETVEYYFPIPALPMLQTAAPEISLEMYSSEGEAYVYIDCNDDPGAAIYYRIFQRYSWDDAWYGDESWYEYYGPFYITNYEYDDMFFRIEAYAKAVGKTESEIAGLEFYLHHANSGSVAYDFCVDGVYYKRLDNTNVEVTRQKFSYYHNIEWLGDEINVYGEQRTSYSGNVVIPSTVTYGNRTYNVVSIGHEAFMYCELTSVELPNSITSISQFAFASTRIGSMVIPESVTSVGQGAFYHCEISDLNFTTPLASLGKGAFCRCNGLKSVALSSQITAIEDYTFLGCSNLTNLEIPSSVRTIGEEAFSGTGLTSMTIPSAVETIGFGAFSDCSNLASVTLPEGLTAISDYMFSRCSALTGIAVPGTVTSIGNYSFSYCAGLTDFSMPASLTSIGSSAFARCTGLTELTVPNAVTSIGSSAFMGCVGLTSVTLPSSLTAINYNTFSGCSNLTGIAIPGAVTSIGYYAFSDCAALASVYLPASVASISMRAFEGCSSLESLQVDGNNPVFDSRDNCNAIIGTADNTLVLGCKNTVIPGTVTSIGDCAFSGCTGLTALSLPNSVTAIGDYAFFNCMEMESITLSESLKTIGNYAFFYCMGLTDITIPASVDTISNNAFYCCNGLETVTCLATTPPAAFQYTFVSCYGATLLVPAESLADYQAADYWNQFANIQPIGGNQTGDLNGDGVLSIQDVTRLIDIVLKGGEYSSEADINGDGRVNIADVTALIRMVLNGGN